MPGWITGRRPGGQDARNAGRDTRTPAAPSGERCGFGRWLGVEFSGWRDGFEGAKLPQRSGDSWGHSGERFL